MYNIFEVKKVAEFEILIYYNVPVLYTEYIAISENGATHCSVIDSTADISNCTGLLEKKDCCVSTRV